MSIQSLRHLWLIPFVGAALAAGVGACSDDAPSSSTLSGTIEQEGFAYPVTRVIASADDGTKMVTTVGSDGAFTIQLDKRRRYTFDLDTDVGSVPMALAGAHGQYALELAIRSGRARANLGRVRFFDAGRGLHDMGAACVGGYFEGSGEPCFVERASIACGRRGRDRDASPGEGSDGPTVVISGEVAIPELSLPAALSCQGSCDDGDSDDDDGARGHHDEDDDHESCGEDDDHEDDDDD